MKALWRKGEKRKEVEKSYEKVYISGQDEKGFDGRAHSSFGRGKRVLPDQYPDYDKHGNAHGISYSYQYPNQDTITHIHG